MQPSLSGDRRRGGVSRVLRELSPTYHSRGVQSPPSSTPAIPKPALRRGAPRPRMAAPGDLVLDVVVRADGPVSAGSDVPGRVGPRAGGSAANTDPRLTGLGRGP